MKISDFRIPTSTFEILHRIVFPSRCLVCGCFFQVPEMEVPGRPDDEWRRKEAAPLSLQSLLDSLLSGCLCRACIGGLVTVESPICDCCGLPYKSRAGLDHRCGACIAEPKDYRIARAAMIYEQVLTQVIHCFKYRGKIQLAGPLAEILLAAFRLFWQTDSIDIILPVPLHPSRFRKRGFNQAYLLVRSWHALAARYSLQPGDLRVARSLLIRTVPTAPQSALGRTQRAVNIKNAFDLNGRDKVKGKRVLLVDDVYTTGATVNECARVLRNCGARHVDVLTLARAV